MGAWCAAGLLNAYLRERTAALEVLPDGLSWKAYWGDAPPSAQLLHWLGPKPAHARCWQCWVANRARGSGWASACACTRVAFKALFQQAPGGMYVKALELYEGYQRAAAASAAEAHLVTE